MTSEEAIDLLDNLIGMVSDNHDSDYDTALKMGINSLKQEPIDKSAMMYEIFMKGVNMTEEYQGCWVRFKDIEKIVDKYMAESEDKK